MKLQQKLYYSPKQIFKSQPGLQKNLYIYSYEQTMFENVNSLHRLSLQNYFIKLFTKVRFFNSLFNIKLLILDMTKCHYIMFTVDISYHLCKSSGFTILHFLDLKNLYYAVISCGIILDKRFCISKTGK